MDLLTSSTFKNFYSSYHNRCFLFAKSYVQDDLAAEDIASESLIKLWELSKTEDIPSPAKLLFVIIKNRALDYLKHQRVKEAVLTDLSDYNSYELELRISSLEATDPDRIFSQEIQEIVYASLSRLPEQTKEIFTMSRFKNLSRKDIAEHFNIAIKTVDYHLSKAIAQLKIDLKDYYILIIPVLFFSVF